MGVSALLAALLLAAASPTPPLDYTPCVDDTTAAGCPGTIQWDAGGGSMAWATGANWSTNVVPAGSDDVCIPDLAAGVEVVHAIGTDAVNSLAGTGGLQVNGGTLSFAVSSPGLGQLGVAGGTLSGTGDLPVSGAFTWSAGVMTGAGVTSASGAALSGAAAKDLTGARVLQTSGTTTWTGTGQIRLNTAAAIQNAGTWDAQGNASISNLASGGGFQNPAGSTFKKTAGGGTTTIAVPLTNGGALSVENGTVSLTGGSSTTGSLQGTADTTLQFSGGAHSVGSGASLAAPTVVVTAGSLTVDGTYSADTNTFSGGTTTFNAAGTVLSMGSLSISGVATVDLSSGEAITPTSLSLLGGTLKGSDTVTVPSAGWSGGDMTGSGTTTVTSLLTLTGSAAKDLSGGRVLRVTDTTWWQDTGQIRLGSGATIRNDLVWDCQGAATMSNLGSAGGFLNAAGAHFTKSSFNTTSVQVPFTNDGTVQMSFGTLSFDGGGTATGAFTGAAGTTLRFAGGTHALGATSSINVPSLTVTAGTVTVEGAYTAGATTVSGGTLSLQPAATLSSIGPISVSGAGTLNLSSGEAVSTSAVFLTGGVLAGSDPLTVSGTFAWSAGDLAGPSAVTASSGLSLSGSAAKDLLGGHTLTTVGTTTWSGTGSLRLADDSSIRVGGNWDVQTNGSVSTLDGTGSLVVLAGATFHKTSPGTTTLSVPVNIAGDVQLDSGTLVLSGGSTTGGTLSGAALTTFEFAAGTHTLLPSSHLSAEAVAVTAGTLSVEGTYESQVATFSGGSTTFQPGAHVVGLGPLTVSNGGRVDFNTGAEILTTSLSLLGGTLAGSDLVGLQAVGGPLPDYPWTGGTMTGPGTTLTQSGRLFLSGAAAKDLTGGRFLDAGDLVWDGTGALRVGGGAHIRNIFGWSLRSDAPLVDLGGAGGFENAGVGAGFRKTGGTGTSVVGIPFTNKGTVHASSGTLQFTAGYTQTAGATLLDGGALAATAPLSIQGGTLGGVGTASASVVSAGTVAPGASAGLLTIAGAYTQGSTGTLAIEIGGLIAGTQYDRLAVTGTATLSGALNVTLVNGFVPQDTNTFTVLTAGSITGAFTSTNLPALPNGLAWLVHVNPTSVVLEVFGDLDGDGVQNASDCAPSDPSAWGVPVEVTGLAIGADDQTLSWAAQAVSAGPGTVYDLVRGLTSALPVGNAGESCLASGTGASDLVDGAVPGSGSAFYYLVRAKNACGVGTYGTRTGGTPRTTADCP